MYNPYENHPYNHENPEQNTTGTGVGQPAAPGYGTGSAPYTAQTGMPAREPAKVEQAVGQPEASPSVTYHTGPVHTGSAYIPGQGGTSPYAAPQPVPGQAAQGPASTGMPQAKAPAYTWNPQNTVQTPPYYMPAQRPPKKKAKKGGGKLALKILAAVVACAVVSFSSVGAFALLIQNGVVNVQSAGNSEKTAAFTIYKREETGKDEATPTVTGESMTAQEVAKKVIPSVVCVQNYQVSQQGNSFFYDFGYEEEDESGISPAGEGSGIIISKDGYIVTNQHVVEGATKLKVVTSEGLTYEAELVGGDTQTDLAVIKVNTEDELTPAEFGSSKDLEVADEVMAIGNPGGLQLNSSVTFGRVSALNRQVSDSDTGYTMSCIQTDAAINPGNSGGALVDMDGHVVGINSSKIVATEYEGLGFAIPSDTVQPVISDLMEYGYVKDRPMLGISGQYIDRWNASFFGLTPGYYVTQVNSDNAAKAGLQRGDVIIAIDDTQVTSGTTLSAYIANKKPGDTVTLTVDRSAFGQQSVEIDLVLSENTGKSGSFSEQG